jgi:hypothetical protein
MMTNTAALFNKLFTTNPSNPQLRLPKNPELVGLHPSIAIQHAEAEDSNAGQLQAVYSTRVPQKKNFSSPDDLQLRIAARKNQHQQLAIATAQNTLQPMRKSANDFYCQNEVIGSISPQHSTPNAVGGKKVLVIVKGSKGSPGDRYRKVNKVSEGRMGSAEKEDYATAYQHQ